MLNVFLGLDKYNRNYFEMLLIPIIYHTSISGNFKYVKQVLEPAMFENLNHQMALSELVLH